MLSCYIASTIKVLQGLIRKAFTEGFSQELRVLASGSRAGCSQKAIGA